MKSDDTSMYDDPSTPGHIRELLSAGRRGGAGYDVERGLARHLAAIGATAPAVDWAPVAAAAKSSVPAWLGFVAMPLAAAAVAGALWFFASDRPAPAPQPAAASAAPAPSEAVGVREAREEEADRAQLSDVEDRNAADEARQPERERRRYGSRAGASVHGRSRGAFGARTAATASEPADLNAVTGVAAAGGEGTPSDSRSDDGASPARSSETTSRTVSKAESNASVEREPEQTAEAEAVKPAAAEAKKPVQPVVDESRLEREMQMLAVTQRVLSSDPARALRLSEQGEREFSGSMLSAERRQLRLLALVKLGRVDEARREGRRFLARYPKAPWSERLRRALATGVVE